MDFYFINVGILCKEEMILVVFLINFWEGGSKFGIMIIGILVVEVVKILFCEFFKINVFFLVVFNF